MGYLGRAAAKAALVSADIPTNSITASHIVADTITAGDLAANSVDSSELVDGSIDTSHIADNQVTLAKMAGGTDGQIITYDASGDPVAVGPGTDGQVLTSTGAGSPPAFEDASGGVDGISSSANATAITIAADESVIHAEMATFSKLLQNPATISANITIASGYSAMAVGPINFTGTVAVNGNLSIV